MNFSTLSPDEIRDLLTQYRSNQRKLEVQIEYNNLILQQLEQYAASAKEALADVPALSLEGLASEPPAPKTKAAPAKKPGRPRKTKVKADAKTEAAAAEAPAKKPGRPRKATTEAAAAEAPAKKPGRPRKATTEAATTEAAAAEAPAKKRGRPRKATTEAAAAEAPAKKPGRPRKTETAAKKPGRPPKVKEEKPVVAAAAAEEEKAFDWEEFIIDCLTFTQQTVSLGELVEVARANPDVKIGPAQIKSKLTPTLSKLINKTKTVVKVEKEGRGNDYALTEWLNQNGDLPKKYARK
jgi:type II secretory pathway pseudopilin PulG